MPDDAWTSAMRAGDFAGAWRISDTVLARRVARGERCQRAPRHLQFIWRGAPLAGRRVLVRCYHGLGDTLQFVRFAAPLARVAAETVFWVQPALLGLVARVPGVRRVLPLHDGAPDADYDVDLEIMELPHALRAGAETLAAHVPYLPNDGAHDSARREPPRVDPLRIGLAATAGRWDDRRSLPASAIDALYALPGVEWHSLDWPAPPVRANVRALGCRDIGELAQRISALDLVISVDTMIAHLAGGLGRPTWTLLPEPCDWRWMHARSDTPWYPTMRLYRQEPVGDWRPALARVAADLAAESGR
jgi:hypothetical protein